MCSSDLHRGRQQAGRRQPALPDVPTVAESGASGTRNFEAVAWQSLVAPAGTPRDVVRKYAQAMAKVMAQPALRAKLEAEGFEPVDLPPMSPDQLAAYIRSETERWGQVIRAAGATVD